ncbi:radical SAM protein [uncultured Muribaculum sp.]|uniref:radical SAM/SPASM domain-containing protein n=1 Tax=uncultured Muribaculum sp. TaxID=1918613 RepID=UPI0025B23CEF|nr:radical SAM protein [uncultured Muribaculum sp.]
METILHKSYYTIPVKLQAEDNKYLLVHGYTGAIDIVDGSIVDAMNAENVATILSEDEISLLSKRGYLTDKTIEEEQKYVVYLADVLHRMLAKLHKSFGFVITYNCNFRCPYCFENIISKNGEAWTKHTMTKELIDKAYDAMLKIEPHNELHKKEILLYGGEPLLRENREIVEYIIRKGIALGYKFKAITNGYDIDYYKDLITPDIFTSLQISIDGFRDNHNRNKRHYIEGDSFDKVIQNIGIVINNCVKAIIRLNLDKNTISDGNRLMQLFSDLGYSKSSYFAPYSAMIENYDQTTSTSNNTFNYMEFLNQTKKGFCFENPAINKLNNAFKTYFKNKKPYKLTPISCNSQFGSFLFDPHGDIFSCLEIVGRKEHSIGNYTQKEIEWHASKNKWFSHNITKSSKCVNCKYALLCGGKCAIKEFNKLNSPNNDCNSFPFLLNQAVNLSYNKYNQFIKIDNYEE